MPELFLVRPLPPNGLPAPATPPTELNLKRAGTTLAAESLASNVITQAATTMNPVAIKYSINQIIIGVEGSYLETRFRVKKRSVETPGNMVLNY